MLTFLQSSGEERAKMVAEGQPMDFRGIVTGARLSVDRRHVLRREHHERLSATTGSMPVARLAGATTLARDFPAHGTLQQFGGPLIEALSGGFGGDHRPAVDFRWQSQQEST
jgi:hypothetical protein